MTKGLCERILKSGSENGKQVTPRILGITYGVVYPEGPAVPRTDGRRVLSMERRGGGGGVAGP